MFVLWRLSLHAESRSEHGLDHSIVKRFRQNNTNSQHDRPTMRIDAALPQLAVRDGIATWPYQLEQNCQKGFCQLNSEISALHLLKLFRESKTLRWKNFQGKRVPADVHSDSHHLLAFEKCCILVAQERKRPNWTPSDIEIFEKNGPTEQLYSCLTRQNRF